MGHPRLVDLQKVEGYRFWQGPKDLEFKHCVIIKEHFNTEPSFWLPDPRPPKTNF